MGPTQNNIWNALAAENFYSMYMKYVSITKNTHNGIGKFIFLIIRRPPENIFFLDFFRCSIYRRRCRLENNKLIVQYLKALFHSWPVTQCYRQFDSEKLFRLQKCSIITLCRSIMYDFNVLLFSIVVSIHTSSRNNWNDNRNNEITLSCLVCTNVPCGFISGNYVKVLCWSKQFLIQWHKIQMFFYGSTFQSSFAFLKSS